MNRTLESYLSRWQLSNPEPLASTFTSDLYKVQTAHQPAVLKILSKIGAKDERGAADALRWFGGHGAVELLRHDNGAMLLELAEGGSLISVVESGRDDEATKIIADLLNKLHF